MSHGLAGSPTTDYNAVIAFIAGSEGRSQVSQLTVRSLSPDLVRLLKIRAAHNSRSAEAEHRRILEQALRPSATEFLARTAALRAETRGRVLSDSAELIREDRDRDHGALDS